jgi:hypothetical protein
VRVCVCGGGAQERATMKPSFLTLAEAYERACASVCGHVRVEAAHSLCRRPSVGVCRHGHAAVPIASPPPVPSLHAASSRYGVDQAVDPGLEGAGGTPVVHGRGHDDGAGVHGLVGDFLRQSERCPELRGLRRVPVPTPPRLLGSKVPETWEGGGGQQPNPRRGGDCGVQRNKWASLLQGPTVNVPTHEHTKRTVFAPPLAPPGQGGAHGRCRG